MSTVETVEVADQFTWHPAPGTQLISSNQTTIVVIFEEIDSDLHCNHCLIFISGRDKPLHYPLDHPNFTRHPHHNRTLKSLFMAAVERGPPNPAFGC